MPARLSALSVIAGGSFFILLTACSGSEAPSDGSSSPHPEHDDVAAGHSSNDATESSGESSKAGGGIDTATVYEAPDGESCVELGEYTYEVDFVGDPKNCMLGAMIKGLFGGDAPVPPVQDKDVEQQMCTPGANPPPGSCEVEGTRCNWLKTSVGRQDGEGGKRIGLVTTTNGVKVFSKTTFAFVGSEHHVLDDGTDMLPKCSWTVYGKKK